MVNENKIIGYRFFPHRVKGEGFFLSVIRKRGKEDENIHNKKKSKLIPLRQIPGQLGEWISKPDQYTFFQWGDVISFLPNEKVSEAQLVIDRLNIVSAGITAATQKHDKVIPEHSLAMSHALDNKNIYSLDLSLSEALDYLRKNSLHREQSKKGFALVAYKSLPLGWVNILSNRINNLYPSNWRIRMS